MFDTFYGNFPSQGYVQATMQPEELAPVQLEIDNIQKDFNSASINDLLSMELFQVKAMYKPQCNLKNLHLFS